MSMAHIINNTCWWVLYMVYIMHIRHLFVLYMQT